MTVEVVADNPEAVEGSKSTQSSIDIMLKGGHSIRLEKGFDEQLLRRILSVMERL